MKVINGTVMRLVPWAIPALTALIFILDLLTPVGLAVSVLYVIPLMMTFFSSRERDPVYFCIVATGLLWANLFLKPATLVSQHGALNRALGMFVLWFIAVGLLQYKRTQSHLTTAELDKRQALQHLMSERVERSQREGLLTAAQEARAYAETAALGAVASRRKAEERYLITQLRLEGIIQSAMDAIITVDERQRILMFNDAAERMFKRQAREMIGQPLDELIPARFREPHRHHIQKFGRSGVTNRKMGSLGTVTGLKADGEEFPVEASISQITVEGKKFYTVILRDLTERKRMEEQLRRTERIAELGTLASGMAHEIGTPMNVILGRAEYLMQRTQEEPLKKGLQTIISQVERITRVMDQLLAFARRKPVERRALDLQKTIEDNLDIFEERLARHRIIVEKSFAGSCPLVFADSDQMSQVMINLVMNALHAMPDGGTLRVGVSPRDGVVRLTVADTGHGIPQDVVDKIFDPFFTTKEFGKGTGLGLTVVKGIIEEHQGTIAVESDSGKGTTFSIDLPVYQRKS